MPAREFAMTPTHLLPSVPPAALASGPALTTPATAHETFVHQAMRVVIYRDSHGVHLAVPGTRVDGLAIEAMIVALAADTDLAAWLVPHD
jgi:hypothetical protein